jgi:hypothetical protein
MILCKEILQPGVPGETAQNIQASNQLALVAAGLLALSISLAIAKYVSRGNLSSIAFSLIGVALMVFHPIWTVSTRSGDCGTMRYLFSFVVAGLIGLFVIVQVLLLLGRRDDSAMRADYEDRNA